MEYLVSVVVPVYKVEKYIRRCVDSIINQTYTNIEIILVDDGSPDNCGSICDEYAKNDIRVKVIHKENGGLSSARNAGIDCSHGKYILFVDSDDWIEFNTIERCYYKAIEYDADIVTFGHYIDFENGKFEKKGPTNEQLIDMKTALIYLNSYRGIDISSWNKFYKREIINDIRFPNGKLCEDYYTIYKFINQSKKILLIPDIFYHYFQRMNSITKNKNINYDYIYAAKEQRNFIIEKYPDIAYAANTGWVFANITMYHIVKKRNVKNEIVDISEQKKFCKDIFNNKYLPFIRKFQYIFFAYITPLYDFYLIIK